MLDQTNDCTDDRTNNCTNNCTNSRNNDRNDDRTNNCKCKRQECLEKQPWQPKINNNHYNDHKQNHNNLK